MITNHETICRICLKESNNMNILFTLKLPGSDSSTVDFIRKITDLQIIEIDTLPRNICDQCVKDVNIAFELTQVCIASDASLRNQETRRRLRQIEEEALGEEIIIKCENLESYQNDEIAPDVSDDNLSENDVKDEKVHFAEIKVNNKYKCEICDLSFNNKNKFSKHLKTHESKPFKCKECLQTFSKKFHLNIHLRSHIKKEDKKFSCDVCGKQFIFEYLLKQHEYKHKEDKPFPCPKCNKGCLTAESLRRHMKIHDETYTKKTHSCHICQKCFPYPSFLAEHMKNHTGEKPHLCPTCGKGFRHSGALHYHQRIHTGYKPFACKICEENFRSQSVLKVHMRKHTNERPYVCDICGVSFRQSTDLKSHHRTHTGEKRVLCTICGKKMSTTGQLTIHLRTHTGEKPYSCSVCSRAFTTKTVLVKHERIHTGERPYICDVCGKAFNQSSTLRTHTKIHKTNSKKRKKVKDQQNKELYLTDSTLVIFKNANEVSETSEGQYIVDEVKIGQEQCETVKAEFTVILPAPIPLLQNM